MRSFETVLSSAARRSQPRARLEREPEAGRVGRAARAAPVGSITNEAGCGTRSRRAWKVGKAPRPVWVDQLRVAGEWHRHRVHREVAPREVLGQSRPDERREAPRGSDGLGRAAGRGRSGPFCTVAVPSARGLSPRRQGAGRSAAGRPRRRHRCRRGLRPAEGRGRPRRPETPDRRPARRAASATRAGPPAARQRSVAISGSAACMNGDVTRLPYHGGLPGCPVY